MGGTLGGTGQTRHLAPTFRSPRHAPQLPMLRPLPLVLSALMLLLPVLLAPTAEAQSDARAIFEEVDRRQKLVRNEEATLRMEIVDPRGRTRTRDMQTFTQVTDDDRTRALLLFTGPADIRGTGLLTVETASGDDQRLYLPTLGRVQRIAGGQRGDRFAGSDFTFEDLGSRNPDDYDLRLAETRADAWVLEARTRRDDSPYSRLVITVDRERYVLTRVEHYDRRDRLARVLTAERFEPVAGGQAFRAGRLTMEDAQAGRRTVLTYQERRTDRTIPDATFTERRLQRGS